MELDEAIAITIEVLQKGQAQQYGYDLYAHTVPEAAAFPLDPHEQFREQKVREFITGLL